MCDSKDLREAMPVNLVGQCDPIRLSSEQARFRKGKLSYNLLPYLLLTESSEASSCNQKNQFKKANF